LPKPPHVTAEYIVKNVAEIERAFASSDADERKAVLKSYDVGIAVDSDQRIVDITIRDPKCPQKATGEPDFTDSDSPVYRPMVAPN
jgi:hypothetical protein